MPPPVPTPPTCPWKEGDLYVVPAPHWGLARVQKAAGGSITLMDCSQADADAAARMVAAYPGLLATLARYETALHRLAGYETDAAVRAVARQAIGLDAADPLDVAAVLAAVEAGSLA